MHLLRSRLRTCRSRRTWPPNSAKVTSFKASVDAGRASRHARPILARLQGRAGGQIIGGMPTVPRKLGAALITPPVAVFSPALSDDTRSLFSRQTVRLVGGFN